MKKLLVVVDMQNDFVTGCLGTQEARAIVLNLVNFVNLFDGDVIYTQDTHYDKKVLYDEDTNSYIESYMDTQEGKRLPVPHCIDGTDGWKIIPELNPKWTLKKVTFGSDSLGKIIKEEAYDEVHFVGVCTGICVISNAVIVKAFNPEARIVIHKDLCACVTPESHVIALKAMQTLQMDVI